MLVNNYSYILKHLPWVSSGNCGKNDCFQVTSSLLSGSIPAMNIADFADSYAAKTDEELVELSAARHRLTIEAQTALAAELAKRRISVQPESKSAELAQKRVTVSAQGDTASLVQLKAGTFIEEVLRFYGGNRWALIQMVFPAVLLSFIAVQFARYQVREMALHLHPLLGVSLPRFALLKATLISGSGWFVSWMVFCVSFAAICSAVEQSSAGFRISTSESFGAIRDQPQRFLVVSAVLLGLFLALEMIVISPISNWIIPLLQAQFGRFSSMTWLVIGYSEFSLIALILARFSLAIPAVILDDNSIADSLLRSYELTRGKWAILAALLFKSIVGAYIAGMLPFWLVRWTPPNVDLPWWFAWALSALSILCVTIVEPIMFIGFALLYLKMTAPARVKSQSVTA